MHRPTLDSKQADTAAPPDGVAVVYCTEHGITSWMVVPAEEARHWATGTDFFDKWNFVHREYVAVDAIKAAALKAGVWRRLQPKLPLRDPLPGETFTPWGCALDL